MTAGAPGVSVIIPTFNRESELAECLAALRAQTHPPLEIIVVDDGSTDGTRDVVRRFDGTHIEAGGGRQPNHCRNLGASVARGELLAFFDSDTVPMPDALEVAARHLGGSGADAVVGLYAVRHRHRNVASQYKNLWIRYSYMQSAGHIDWIFGAVSVIRRETFVRAGGFDRTLMMTHGGEDLELGKRMATQEVKIFLDPACEVEHLKRHTLGSLLRNDLLRSEGFVYMAGRVGHLGQSVHSGFVNIYPAFVYSVPLSCLVIAAAGGAVVSGAFVGPAAAFGALYIALNMPFLLYFGRHRGLAETLQAFGILFLDHCVCAAGGVRGVLRHLAERARQRAGR